MDLATPPFDDDLFTIIACYFQLRRQSLRPHACLVHVAAMPVAHRQATMPCARVWKVTEATRMYSVDPNAL